MLYNTFRTELRNVSRNVFYIVATIKDIAKTLNISVSTVSYALNGGPRTVPQHVKDKVLTTAKELGYRPNRNARSLITRRTNTIGVVPPQLGTNIAMSPFIRDSLNGIVNESESSHYDVLLFTRCDQSQTEEMLNDVLDGRVDGLIFLAPPIGSSSVNLVYDFGLPTVVTCSNGYAAPCYSSDNRHGVQIAMDHLVSLGHRKIGHLEGRPTLEDSVSRKTYFLEYVQENGLICKDDWIICGNFDPEGGYLAGKHIFESQDRPTAIFCGNDEMAFGLIRAAREYGIKIPEELSIIGFDDSSLCNFTYPLLTSVRQPIEELASFAFRSIIEMIEGHSPSSSSVFPTELIIRESTSNPTKDNYASIQ